MSWLAAVQQIKNEHQARRIDTKTGHLCAKSARKGAVLMDAFTANMLITVYEALNEENKAKFTSLPILKAVQIGWKCVK